MPIIKYLGPTRTATNCIGEPVELTESEEYDVEIQYQGQTIFVNGQPMQDPNGIYWVTFQSGSKLPYNAECIKKQWSINI